MNTAETCTDARGTAHPRARSDARVVSLVPSLTELLCDLGVGDRLVGRTGFCIHPRAEVKRIQKVGGTKDVDIEKLRALKPSHVILNIDENRREIVEPLSEFVEQIFVTHPMGPEDNLSLYESFGFLFSAEQRANDLKQKFQSALADIRALTDRPQQRVLYLIWRDPWMTVTRGTYISQMLELVNWKTVPDRSTDRYPAIELNEYVGRVDKVLLSSEPYPFRDKHLKEVRSIVGEETEVKLVDGEMLSWYGSRAIAGLAYLNELVTQDAPAASA